MSKKKWLIEENDKENTALLKNLDGYAGGKTELKDIIIHQLGNRAKRYHIGLKKIGAINLQCAIDAYKKGDKPKAQLINQLYSSL